MGLELEDQQYVSHHLLRCNGARPTHPYRKQVIEHLQSKAQRTDPQKVELQERRNVLTRRIKLWKTAQAVYMPQVSGFLLGEQDLPGSDDPYEFDESKPELWPLLLPSDLSQDNRSLCHKGVVETEHTLRLAQVQDNLVDLRRLRRTLRSLKTYFKSNVIGEGLKTQTKSRAIESGVTVRINRAVRRYRLAYSALLSLDPDGDWRKEYLELTDKDNRGPGKELFEKGVGDGRYMMSWIWGGFSGGTDPVEGEEVNETVRHEWMTCRARADRWMEESSLLQEEMRRVIAFLEWTSSLWSGRVGSRLGSVAVDVQHGIDSYARKQENTYHALAVSLANQWLPHLVTLGLNITWAKTYPWAAEIVCPSVGDPPDSSNVHENPLPGNSSTEKVAPPSEKRDGVIEPVTLNDSSGDESDDGDPEVGEGHICDEGEDSDGLTMGFEYDDEYMS